MLSIIAALICNVSIIVFMKKAYSGCSQFLYLGYVGCMVTNGYNRPTPFFVCVDGSASVYCKPKNRKNRVGLGMRLGLLTNCCHSHRNMEFGLLS